MNPKIIYRHKDGTVVGIDDEGNTYKGKTKQISHSSLTREVKKEKDRVNVTYLYNDMVYAREDIPLKNYVEQSEDDRRAKDTFDINVTDWEKS